MQLEFTEEQEELRAAVRALLGRECPPDFVRAVFEGSAAADPLWAHQVELGWPALTVSEEDGGLGLTFVEVGIVVEELGRAVAPGPFATTVGQFLPAVLEAADPTQRKEWTAAVVSGEVTATLADGAVTSTPAGDGWQLDGRVPAVVGLGDVTHVGVVADDGTSVFVVDAAGAGVAVEAADPLDRTRSLGTLVLDGHRVDADAAFGVPGEMAAAVERVRQQAACATALELLGVCEAIFDMTLAYAKEREQFGRPIGSFQAIKHKLADCYVAIQKAHALCYFAALTIAEDDLRRGLAVSMAKAGAGDCQRLVAKEGLQIHGGIGYTWEHDLHFLLRRAKTLDAVCGTAASHRGRVAELAGL